MEIEFSLITQPESHHHGRLTAQSQAQPEPAAVCETQGQWHCHGTQQHRDDWVWLRRLFSCLNPFFIWLKSLTPKQQSSSASDRSNPLPFFPPRNLWGVLFQEPTPQEKSHPKGTCSMLQRSSWNRSRAEGSTGALLTGSKAIGGPFTAPSTEAPQDNDYSLPNRAKIPIFSLLHRGTHSSVQTGPSSQPGRQAQCQHGLHKARNSG